MKWKLEICWSSLGALYFLGTTPNIKNVSVVKSDGQWIIFYAEDESHSPSVGAKGAAEFDKYIIEARNEFVKAITDICPHEMPDAPLVVDWGYIRRKLRVSSENILIAYDQMRDALAGFSHSQPVTNAMSFREMFDGLKLNRDFMSEEEFQTICDTAELYAKGCLREGNQGEAVKIVVWKDGTYKEVSGETWEYENDDNWLVTIQNNKYDK